MKLGQLLEVEFERERLPATGDLAYIDGFLYLTHIPIMCELWGKVKSVVYATDRFAKRFERQKKLVKYRHPFDTPVDPEFNRAKGWIRFPVEMQRDKLGRPTFIMG